MHNSPCSSSPNQFSADRAHIIGIELPAYLRFSFVNLWRIRARLLPIAVCIGVPVNISSGARMKPPPTSRKPDMNPHQSTYQ